MIRIKETLAASTVEIAGQTALNHNSLGANITESSLTRVGTLTEGTWSASVISSQYGGTGVNNQGKTITLAGNLTTQGAYPITIIATGDTEFTLPTSGSLATADNEQTYTNKTFNLAAENNNTLTGTIAEFNLALSDQDFATLAGTETLTNKTVNLTNNTLSGTVAQFNSALSDGSFATLAGTETLTNKTVDLANNTLSGTLAQFNTALSDGSFATLAGTETLTNKTINLNSASGNTLTGTLTEFNSALNGADFASLSGTETLTNKTVNLANNSLSGTVAQFNSALSDGSFATLAGTETLTNKSIDLGTNTLSGSIAEFNASLQLATFVTSDASTNDTVLPGDLKVTASFEIDPTPHDAIGGTVVIQGDLDVKGTIIGTQGDNQKVYTATGAISAGDIVSLLPDGTVEVTQERTNQATTNQGPTASVTGSGYAQVIYDPLNAKWFNFYESGATMGYQVGTVSGNSITWGTATTTWGVDTFPGDPSTSSRQTFSVAIRPSDGVMLMTSGTNAGLHFLKLKWNTENSQIDILEKWEETASTGHYGVCTVYMPPYNKFFVAYQREINSMMAQSFEIGDASTHAITNGTFSSNWLNGVTGGGGYISAAQDFQLRFNPYNNKIYVLIDYYGVSMTNPNEYNLIEVTLGTGGSLSGASAAVVDLGFTIGTYNTNSYGEQQGRRQFAFDGSILVIPGIANSNDTLQLIYAVDLSTSPYTVASTILQVMSLSTTASHGAGGHCEFSAVDNHFFFTYYNTNDETATDFYNSGYNYNTLRVTGAGTGSLTLDISSSNSVNLASSGDNRQANLVAGGDYVMYRQGTESFLINRQISTITNAADWIGIAAEDIADTEEGLIDLTGSINKSQTSLVKGTVYYVNELGTLSTGATEYGMIGKALSSTDLQIFGNATIELSSAIDVDFSNNSPTTTSGLVLTSDGDKSYSFQSPSLVNLVDVDTTINTPSDTNGLVLTSDGDSSYSFQPVITIGDNQKTYTASIQIDAGTVVGLLPDNNISPTKLSTEPTATTIDNPNTWDVADGDSFGKSVSMSDSYFIVGAHLEKTDNKTGSGIAYIYDINGTLLYTLENPNAEGAGATNDNFGWDVAISESYAVVSAYKEDPSDGAGSYHYDAGIVYLYDLSTLTPGVVTTATFTLDNPEPASGAKFGLSVDVSENYVIASTNNFKVFIFDTETGTYLYKLDSYGISFGKSVAINDTHAVVGMPFQLSSINSYGVVYIYEISTLTVGSNASATNIFENPTPNNTAGYVGASVSINETSFIAGNPTGADSSHSAYVVDLETGNLIHEFINPDAALGAFATSVAISTDWSIVGRIGGFCLYDNVNGTLIHQITRAELDSPWDQVGHHVGINNTRLIVGSQTAADGGKVYIYTQGPNITYADNWIGITAESIAPGEQGKVDLTGAINRQQSGLTIGQVYNLDNNGNLVTSNTEYGLIGKAISATDLQIFGNATSELATAVDVDLITYSAASTTNLYLTSNGDKTYKFAPIDVLLNNQIYVTPTQPIFEGDLVVTNNGSYGSYGSYGSSSGLQSWSYDTASTAFAATTSGPASAIVYDPTTDRHVLFRKVSSGSVKAVVVQATDTGFVYGNELEFYNYYINTLVAIIDKKSKKILCAWTGQHSTSYTAGLRAALFTVNPLDNSITIGNIVSSYSNLNAGDLTVAQDPVSGKILFSYGQSGDCVINIGSTTNDNLTILPSISASFSVPPTQLAYDQSSKRFVAIWSTYNQVIELTSDNTLVFGQQITRDNGVNWLYTPPYFIKSLGKLIYSMTTSSMEPGISVITIDTADNSCTVTDHIVAAKQGGTPEEPYFAGSYTALAYSEFYDQAYFYYRGSETPAEFIADVIFSGETPSLSNLTSLGNENTSGYFSAHPYGKNSISADKIVSINFIGSQLELQSVALDNIVTNLNWVGLAAENIAPGEQGKVDLTGAINRKQGGLTSGQLYYVSQTGSILNTPTDYGMIGRAINSTELEIFGNATSEFSTAVDIDFTTNTPTTTSGLVLTSDGDSTYSFQQPVATTQIADLTDVDFTTNTPTTTSGLVLTSDGDSTYSFQSLQTDAVSEGTNLYYTDARVDARLASGSVGDVIIGGNLQVNGTTTTINTTNLTIEDKNIEISKGATNSTASDGAGITVDLGTDGTATILYDATNDDWKLNKALQVADSLNVTSAGAPTLTIKTTFGSSYDATLTIAGARTASSTSEIAAIRLRNETSSAYDLARIIALDPSGDHASGNGMLSFKVSNNGTLTQRLVISNNGNVGIGTGSPTEKLEVIGNIKGTGNVIIRHTNTTNITGPLSVASTNTSSLTLLSGGSQSVLELWTDTGIEYGKISFGNNPSAFHEVATIVCNDPTGVNCGFLEFNTMDQGGNTALRLAINESGNVCINTTYLNGNDKLQVGGNIGLLGSINLQSSPLATFAVSWTIARDANQNLIFSYEGVNKMKLDTSGNLTVVGNITAYGTI